MKWPRRVPAPGAVAATDTGVEVEEVATFKGYANGVTMGISGGCPPCRWGRECCPDPGCCRDGGRVLCCLHGPAKRGEVVGWSAGAVRRHKRWLYSVAAPELDGVGMAVTLTMRDTPATSEIWQDLLRRLFRRLRDSGMVRWHWVVEWQRRGTPHIHLAVYGAEGSDPAGVTVRHWMGLAQEFGAQPVAQFITPIAGPVGWLKYLSKHASRGVAHYQRQGKPAGWTKTGRLWGYGGSWPCAEPVEGLLTTQQYWRVRRMVRGYAIAQARRSALEYARQGKQKKAAAAWDSVGWLRGMLSCPDRAVSSVRGISEWVPGPVLVQMALAAGWQGEMPGLPAGAAPLRA